MDAALTNPDFKDSAPRRSNAVPCSALAKCDCGANVEINTASGGTRYEAAMFSVECPQCGTVVEDCIPSNCSGRRRDAVAEWNRIQKAKKQNDQTLPTPAPTSNDTPK